MTMNPLSDFDTAFAAEPQELLLEWNGNVLVSQFTDDQAAAVCERIPSHSQSRGFTQMLIRDLRRYGELFPGKRYWLHDHAYAQLDRERVAAEAEAIRLAAEEDAKYGGEPNNFDKAAGGQVPNVAAFMARGSGATETGPRVTFESGEFMVSIRSTAAGKTRWPGGFMVVGCTGFGAPNVPLAMIDANGYLYWSDAGRFRTEVRALLDEFELNPAEFVSANGVKSGRCVFCRRELTDPISLTMGYGEICAGHYALPWSASAMACRKAKQNPPEAA
jgi:hypothetical protein